MTGVIESGLGPAKIDGFYLEHGVLGQIQGVMGDAIQRLGHQHPVDRETDVDAFFHDAGHQVLKFGLDVSTHQRLGQVGVFGLDEAGASSICRCTRSAILDQPLQVRKLR
jgi:hypothetical protein